MHGHVLRVSFSGHGLAVKNHPTAHPSSCSGHLTVSLAAEGHDCTGFGAIRKSHRAKDLPNTLCKRESFCKKSLLHLL